LRTGLRKQKLAAPYRHCLAFLFRRLPEQEVKKQLGSAGGFRQYGRLQTPVRQSPGIRGTFQFRQAVVRLYIPTAEQKIFPDAKGFGSAAGAAEQPPSGRLTGRVRVHD